MKEPRKKDTEPTLTDVVEIMQAGFGRIETRLDGVETRLGGVEMRLGNLEGRTEQLEDSNRHIISRLGTLEEKVSDMHDDLAALSNAFDHDTVFVMQHEQRIAQLEKARV